MQRSSSAKQKIITPVAIKVRTSLPLRTRKWELLLTHFPQGSGGNCYLGVNLRGQRLGSETSIG